MPIDTETALAADPQISEISWTSTDVLLYHLSLGAGSQADEPELRLTFERDLKVLPTFGLVAGKGPSSAASGSSVKTADAEVGKDGSAAESADGSADAEAGSDTASDPTRMRLPGIDVDLRAVLHAGQSLTAHRPLPVSGTAEVRRSVAQIHDLGKAALIVLETSAVDADGPLWTEHSRIYVRGEGRCGGEPAPAPRPVPERAPETSVRVATRPNQALLYRLNGDLNPLHIDPEFARSAGLPGPILHGLATYGIVTKALTDIATDGRPELVAEVGARFSGMVTPGDVLILDVWETGPGQRAYRARAEGSEQTVLDEGVLILN